MSKLPKYQRLFVAGAVIIALTPIWWFIVPSLISPMFCNPAAEYESSPVIIIAPCSNVYIPLTIGFTLGNLALGIFLLLFGSYRQSKAGKRN